MERESTGGSSPQWFVHRWTASALERQEELAVETAEEDKAERHRRAAAYWMWHYRTTAQSREADVEDLLECYAHFGEAGDVEQSDDAAQRAASILNRIGRWDDEWKLANRQLQDTRLGKSRQEAWHYQLGMLAQARGDYDTARKLYQQALAIFEELGDRAGMANTYHNLGVLAQDRGDTPNNILYFLEKSFKYAESISATIQTAQIVTSIGICALRIDAIELIIKAFFWLLHTALTNNEMTETLGVAIAGFRELYQSGYSTEVDSTLAPFFAKLPPEFAQQLRSLIETDDED